MRKLCFLLLFGAFLGSAIAQENKPSGPPPGDTSKAKKPANLVDKVKGSRKIDDLFTLYQDTATGGLQIYVKKNQLGKEFIYQSFSMGGPASLFLNQNMIRENWVFSIRKKFERLEFCRSNTNFYYDPSNAISKAANVDVADADFFTDKIAFKDSAGYFINADGLFLSDKLDQVKPNFPPTIPATAYFNLGSLNPVKSSYSKVR